MSSLPNFDFFHAPKSNSKMPPPISPSRWVHQKSWGQSFLVSMPSIPQVLTGTTNVPPNLPISLQYSEHSVFFVPQGLCLCCLSGQKAQGQCTHWTATDHIRAQPPCSCTANPPWKAKVGDQWSTPILAAHWPG